MRRAGADKVGHALPDQQNSTMEAHRAGRKGAGSAGVRL